MKKIAIIGCPGSGKSTFARALQQKLELPLHYLDMLFWNSDKTTVDRETFDERLQRILETDSWIIDGNYARTVEMRLQKCDTVFFFDLPKEDCLIGVKNRVGKPRPDMPWIETEVDPEFEQFITDFADTTRPKLLSLLEKYRNVELIVFHSRLEAEKYLENL